MGPVCKTACLLILGLYIPFQLVDTFYFNFGDDDEQRTKEFFGPFINLNRPIRVDKEKERKDEMKSSRKSELADFLPPDVNTTHEPDQALLRESGLGCNSVRQERSRCCRVFDQVIEAWWCPERRPFCCHQGTSCAVCCTPDGLRRAEDSPPPASCQQGRRRQQQQQQQQQQPAVDDNWFWTGMKAAWLTMFAILLASICCTCFAYKYIKFLVSIANEEDSDLEEEYLAFHFDNLGLTSAEDRPPSRPAGARGLLPPKYSDINFTPAQPEAPASAPVPGEPPPQYTSEPEPEPEPELGTAGDTGETETITETRTVTETAQPPGAPPPAGQI